MRITYYRQNAFKIASGTKKILVDPGRSLSSFRSLIPKEEWEGTNLLLVTHRDPDHFAFVAAIASRFGPEVICSTALGPLMETRGIRRTHFLTPGERLSVQGVEILGLPAVHGPGKATQPSDKCEDPKGSIGFSVRIEGKNIANLGDTVFLEAWKGLEADVLMIPMGGYFTMNRKEAVRAAKLIRPGLVIPTHFHWKMGPYVHPAKVTKFSKQMLAEGIRCVVLGKGESIEV